MYVADTLCAQLRPDDVQWRSINSSQRPMVTITYVIFLHIEELILFTEDMYSILGVFNSALR